MLCGWEGWSGVALATRHRQQWCPYLPAHGLRVGDEPPPDIPLRNTGLFIPFYPSALSPNLPDIFSELRDYLKSPASVELL